MDIGGTCLKEQGCGSSKTLALIKCLVTILCNFYDNQQFCNLNILMKQTLVPKYDTTGEMKHLG